MPQVGAGAGDVRQCYRLCFGKQCAGTAVHPLDMQGECLSAHILFAFMRSELPTTDTLENAMANPANTGERSQPKTGKSMPLASGIPTMLYMKAQKRFCSMQRIVIF